jgi:sigma-E factor negative regulatory protein RseB
MIFHTKTALTANVCGDASIKALRNEGDLAVYAEKSSFKGVVVTNPLKPGLKVLLLLLIMLLVTPVSFASDDLSAEQWIAKMREAATYSSYRGTFMFSRGDMSSSMRVVHRFKDGEEQERLTQLDGEMGEILRRGMEVICLVGEHNLVKLEKGEFGNPVSSSFKEYMPGQAHYRLEKRGIERVVNRPAKKLLVEAQDLMRYSYRLWLDHETGLLLKSQVVGDDGQSLETFQFTSLEIPTQTKEDEFTFDMDSEAVVMRTIPMSQPDKLWPSGVQWNVAWVPSGFKTMSAPGNGRDVMLYSDGLASFSVFVEKRKDEMLPIGASMVGATTLYFSEFAHEGMAYAVTVVGEIPAMTAMKVAKGVKAVME